MAQHKKEHKTDSGLHAQENGESAETVTPEVCVDAPETTSAVNPLAEAETQIKQLKEKYTYLMADYDNYRRRVARDLQSARTSGVESALNPILNIFEHVRMAVSASEQTDNVEKIREGLRLIMNEFSKSIRDMGIEIIDPVGEQFDPNLHEAISNMPSDHPEGVVTQQWSSGFRLNGRLLRPARVVVSSGPAKS